MVKNQLKISKILNKLNKELENLKKDEKQSNKCESESESESDSYTDTSSHSDQSDHEKKPLPIIPLTGSVYLQASFGSDVSLDFPIILQLNNFVESYPAGLITLNSDSTSLTSSIINFVNPGVYTLYYNMPVTNFFFPNPAVSFIVEPLVVNKEQSNFTVIRPNISGIDFPNTADTQNVSDLIYIKTIVPNVGIQLYIVSGSLDGLHIGASTLIITKTG